MSFPKWSNGGVLSHPVKFHTKLRRVRMSSHSCRVVVVVVVEDDDDNDVVCCTLSVPMPCDPRYVSCARGQF